MRTLLKLALLLLFASCSTPSILEYKNDKPYFKFEEFFNGKLIAHGVFKDRNNKVTKRFIVHMRAFWKDNNGIIEEDYSYLDGSKSRRVWSFAKLTNGEYHASASDTVGFSNAKVIGSTFFSTYVLKLGENKNYMNVNVENWMYLIDETTIINQSYLSKFNVNLGQFVMSIQKIK